PYFASTLVSAAVKVVLPWSTWPMVPTFRWGLVRSNFSLDMADASRLTHLGDRRRFARLADRHHPRLAGFLQHFLGHVRRDRGIALELHGVGRTPLGRRAQRRRIAEHVRQRHLGTHELDAADAVLLAHDHPATGVEVADHAAEIVRRGRDLDVHQRLEQDRIALGARLAPAHDRGHLERVLARIHLVIRAEMQRRLHVHHRVAELDAALHRLLQALLHGRDVLARNHAALDGVHELEALARLLGLELDHHVAVLTAPAGLLDVLVFLIDRLANGLAVGDLRLADVRLDVELALHAVDDDLEVQLAHAGDDGL